MSELTEALERLADRGAPGDAARVIADALDRVGDETSVAPAPRDRRVLVLAAALVLVVGAIAATVGYVHAKTDRIQRVAVGSLGDDDAVPNVMTVLAVGVETRDDLQNPDVEPGKRLDALMLMRLNRVTGATAVLSLPRDIADSDGNRLSGSPSISPTRVVEEVQRLTGVTVDHYLEFNFARFKELVDAIGGIRIPVAQPLRDQLSGLHLLEPGCVTLDGETTLAYVRSRHLQMQEADGRWIADPTGDIGRIQRQQQLVHAALTQWRAHANDPARIDHIIDAAIGALRLDQHFSTTELIRFARDWQRHNATLRLLTFPTVPAPLPNGAMVLQPNTGEVGSVVAMFNTDDVTDQPATPSPTCR